MGTYIFEDTYKKTQELERQREGLPPIERTKRRVGWFHWLVLFVGITAIVYSQSHDTVAVEVPVHDGRLIQEYQTRLDLANKMVADYKKQAEVVKGLLKVSLANEAKLTDQLKALSASVPSQPVILEAIQKEAVTEKGFHDLVARNFGSEIAKRVEVRE